MLCPADHDAPGKAGRAEGDNHSVEWPIVPLRPDVTVVSGLSCFGWGFRRAFESPCWAMHIVRFPEISSAYGNHS